MALQQRHTEVIMDRSVAIRARARSGRERTRTKESTALLIGHRAIVQLLINCGSEVNARR